MKDSQKMSEQIKISSEVISGKDLLAEIETSPDRNRFQDKEKGGVFYFSPTASYAKESTERWTTSYVVLRANKQIVGLVRLDLNGGGYGYPVLRDISIDNTMKSTGLSKQLLRAVFEHLRTVNSSGIELTSYTEEGRDRVASTIRLLAQEFKIQTHPNASF